MLCYKKEFIEALAQREGITKAEATKHTDAFLDVLTDKCIEGGVSFKGVITLKNVVKKGRSGKVNGVEYHTEDKNSLKISVGSELEAKLNQ